jgi:hypothetical protein
MKFKVLLEDLLNELSGEEIYQKYYNKIPYDDFLSIVSSDPQTSVQNGKLTRMGKYSKLLLAMYQKGGLKGEDLEKAKEYLGYVYQHKVPLDLGKINELGDLYNVIKDYIVKDTKSLDEILKVLNKEEYKVLHNGNEWYVFQPLTEKASCYLGVSTEWCTTWGPYSLDKKHKDRGSMFNRYNQQGPLYIMINKNNPEFKFQFHFESKQYMDKNDKRINPISFFDDKEELKYYFFPSLVKKVTDEELQKELKRIDILTEEEGLELIRKTIGQINNPLVVALLNDDVDTVSSLVTDTDDLNGSVDIDGGRFIIPVERLRQETDELNNKINYYEYEADHGWEFVYDDMRDKGDDEYDDDHYKSIMTSYYEEHSGEILETLGIRDLNDFISSFFDNYKNNEDIKESYWSDIADLSYRSYEEANELEVESIKAIIDIDYGYEIKINIVKFVQFLVKENVTEINDIWGLLDYFIKKVDLDSEFERIYDYQVSYPKYNESNQITKETDKFFDKMLEDSETTHKCVELRKQLGDITQRYFKNSNTFENEHIKVTLKSREIDCDKGMVKIEYTNKDTGETYGGWRDKNDGVRIENLVSLMTNYKLFENLIKFKKNTQ